MMVMDSTETVQSKVAELQQAAKELRRKSLEIIHNAGSGHPGGSLSAADIVAALYFGVMKYDSKNPKDPKRDRFLLSKGPCTGRWTESKGPPSFSTVKRS